MFKTSTLHVSDWVHLVFFWRPKLTHHAVNDNSTLTSSHCQFKCHGRHWLNLDLTLKGHWLLRFVIHDHWHLKPRVQSLGRRDLCCVSPALFSSLDHVLGWESWGDGSHEIHFQPHPDWLALLCNWFCPIDLHFLIFLSGHLGLSAWNGVWSWVIDFDVELKTKRWTTVIECSATCHRQRNFQTHHVYPSGLDLDKWLARNCGSDGAESSTGYEDVLNMPNALTAQGMTVMYTCEASCNNMPSRNATSPKVKAGAPLPLSLVAVLMSSAKGLVWENQNLVPLRHRRCFGAHPRVSRRYSNLAWPMASSQHPSVKMDKGQGLASGLASWVLIEESHLQLIYSPLRVDGSEKMGDRWLNSL